MRATCACVSVLVCVHTCECVYVCLIDILMFRTKLLVIRECETFCFLQQMVTSLLRSGYLSTTIFESTFFLALSVPMTVHSCERDFLGYAI